MTELEILKQRIKDLEEFVATCEISRESSNDILLSRTCHKSFKFFKIWRDLRKKKGRVFGLQDPL